MSRTALLFRTTALIVIITMASRVIGFLRQVLITNEFGLGWETDAYFFAFNIPSTLFLVLPGAVHSVLIPTLKGLMGDEHLLERQRLFHRLAVWTGLLFLVITAAGMIWSAEIVRALAPAFSPDKQHLTAELLRIMMPSVFFIGLISVMTGFLNAHEQFVSPAVGPVYNGLAVIASIYLLGPFLGMKGVAWGTTAGFAVFAASLAIPMFRSKYRFLRNTSLRPDVLMRSMGERFVPILAGMAVSQLYLFVEKIFAGGLGDQKISALWLAFSVVQLPIAIFSGSLAVPLFPLLSEYAKRNEMDGMKRVMAKGFLYQYHVLLPATVGIILLAVPFARLFDYSDNFTVKDTMLTAWALAFYAAGMVGWAGRDLLTRASYALENTRTPVIVSLISFLVYLPCALVLMRQLDHGGLALAYSLVSFLNMALQAVMLRKQIGRLFDRTFYASLGKGAAASAVMAAVIWAASALAVRLSGAESLPLHGEAVDALASLPALPGGWLGAVWLAGIVALAAAAYAGVLVAMKDDTAAELLARFIPRRFQIGRRDKEVD